jgi:lipoprotein-anchoring transpeptidase ErfK/SrfK
VAIAALTLSACSSSKPNTTNTSANGGNAGTSGAAAPSSPSDSAAASSAAAAADLSITPAGSDQINPTTPIVVKSASGKLTSVTVTNTAKNTTVKGAISSDGSTWTSSAVLGYGASYKVDAISSAGEKTSTLTTIKPTATAYPNLVPGPSSVSSVGVGQPLVIQFDHAVTDRKLVEKNITVTSSAGDVGAWYWLSNKELHYRAANYWKANQTLHLVTTFYGKDLGGGVYGDDDRDVTYKVHDAMVAKADGNTHVMTIYKNGAQINSMPISIGKDATPTHLGAHVISFKAAAYTMTSCSYGVCSGPQAYTAQEKYTLRISNDGEFVHENPHTVAQQGVTNVSHGCINLSEANAIWMFNNFNIGDVVEVTNSGGQQLPLYDTYGDWAVSWSTWQAGNA